MNNKGCLVGIIGLAVFLVLLVVGVGFLGVAQFKPSHSGVVVVSSEDKEEQQGVADPMNVKVKILQTQKSDAGISYGLELTNNTGATIAQNDVYLCYDVKGPGNKISTSKLKVEAQGNQLDILAGKSITLTVFIPQTELEGNKNFLLDKPIYEVEGYFESVAEANHFFTSRDFEKN